MYAAQSSKNGIMAIRTGHIERRRFCSMESNVPAKVVNSVTQSSMTMTIKATDFWSPE